MMGAYALSGPLIGTDKCVEDMYTGTNFCCTYGQCWKWFKSSDLQIM